MIAAAQPEAVARFRSVIASRVGLEFDAASARLMADVLARRLSALRLDVGVYLTQLEAGPSLDELGCLARDLTIPETSFFRGAGHFDVLADLLRASAVRRAAPLRLLSLGCASGEEPYSMAMVAREVLEDAAADLSIVGVDLNPAALDKARRGRYSAWALRETSELRRRRWFRKDHDSFVLQPAVRAAVRFEQRNLAAGDPTFWLPGSADVIFCRNMLMYFEAAQARSLVERLALALAPGGRLFLGHAETLRGLSDDFHLRHARDAFYYERKDGRAARRASTAADGPARPASPEPGTWVQAIERASARVATLSDATPTTSSTPPAPRPDLTSGLDLLREERYGDALALVDTLPDDVAPDCDVLLLRAVLLTHAGRFAEAEAACRTLLDLDSLSAGAHYLLALCREGAGDPTAAAEHDRIAAYLDPAFAMPRLHLGLTARRAGRLADARRELEHALVRLQQEDASRILLFGGGFSRDALVGICRAELERCAGTP